MSYFRVSYKHAIILLLGIIFCIFIYWAVRDIFFLEPFCEQEAESLVGNSWTKLIPADAYDRKWKSALTSDNKIYWGVHEELQCEKQDKPFGIF